MADIDILYNEGGIAGGISSSTTYVLDNITDIHERGELHKWDYIKRADEIALLGAGSLYPALTNAEKRIVLRYFEKGSLSLTVTDIVWQSGTTVRITFSGAPDLSEVYNGDVFVISAATNVTNNGEFSITDVNDASDWIEINNVDRTDATDDETTVSLASSINYDEHNDPLFNADSHEENDELDEQNRAEARKDRRRMIHQRYLKKAIKKGKLTPSQVKDLKNGWRKYMNKYVEDGLKGKSKGDNKFGISDYVNNDSTFAKANISSMTNGTDESTIIAAGKLIRVAEVGENLRITNHSNSSTNDYYEIHEIGIYDPANDRTTLKVLGDTLSSASGGGKIFPNGVKTFTFNHPDLNADISSIIDTGLWNNSFLA